MQKKWKEKNLNIVSSHHFASDNVTVVNEFEERTAYLTHALTLLVRKEYDFEEDV